MQLTILRHLDHQFHLSLVGGCIPDKSNTLHALLLESFPSSPNIDFSKRLVRVRARIQCVKVL